MKDHRHKAYLKEKVKLGTCKWKIIQNKWFKIQYNSFNLGPDNLALLTVWHLRKVVPRWEVPPSVTSVVQTDSVTIFWVMQTLLSILSYYNGFKRSKDE
jgi:hypothetical protein